MTMKHVAGIAAVICALLAAAAPASAQQYPNRNVTIIVPYPAGGPTDQTARVVAQSMGTQLKQSFVVENISGGNTIVACEKVAHSTSRRLHADPAQSADLRERDPVQEAAVRHRAGFYAGHADQP